ncbi:hypothetical protein SLS60_011047 [Paraconiothyrium brasiliense]|uniref:Protein kinase domain-containing protein n=1 Tax=Paraconiothyrium brasiliense TaxID=300254 RepID=A0ABR3QKF2_9PLEO
MPDDHPDAGGVSPMYVVDEFPSQYYVPLATAGSGSYGVVYFSLRKEDYNAAVKAKAANTFENLRSKLVAVKVCPDMSLQSAEVKTLQVLRDSVDKDTERMFASLINSGHPWIATKAIAPSISLFRLVELQEPVARELVLHLLLEMTKACHFMYEVSKPRLAHRDLHLGNMLIDASYQTRSGFPGLVVIDFDQSETVDAIDAWKEYRVDAWALVSALLQIPYGIKPAEGWDAIYQTFFSATGPVSLRELSDTMQAMLTEALANVTPEKMRSILDPIKTAIEKNEADLRHSFREAGLME